jgi:hypothetical protein
VTIRFMFGHGLLSRLVSSSGQAFKRDSVRLEWVQRRQLASLLRDVAATPLGQRKRIDPDWSYERYAEALPLTGYDDWHHEIQSQRLGGASLISSPVQRYQPTSGSTSAIKWLPYTRRFLRELDQAIAPWLGDLYHRYPAIRDGSHYWSLSWVPTALRDELKGQINDDMKLLSFGKQWLASLTQAVPESVATATSSEDSRFATLAWLVADERLSVMSVWSPTFALALFDDLSRWRDELAACLRSGHFGGRSVSLSGVRCPRTPGRAALLRDWDGAVTPAFLARLWPNLTLVSAWDTASASSWAAKLRRLLPAAEFQGKGLWATEGVVTLPWRGRYPLAFRSHVYEFVDAVSGRLVAPWQLQKGQEVMPVISTGAGLLRYRMNDRMRVDGFINTVPTLTFLGRDDGVDLVGEKLSAVLAQQLVDELGLAPDVQPVTLLGLDNSDGKGTPGYVLLLENSRTVCAAEQLHLAQRLERKLQTLFHYRLARELNQLAPVGIVSRPDMQLCYQQYCQRRGMVEGNIKLEPLRYWPGMQLSEMVPSQSLAGVA